jgi:hypothetical protein
MITFIYATLLLVNQKMTQLQADKDFIWKMDKSAALSQFLASTIKYVLSPAILYAILISDAVRIHIDPYVLGAVMTVFYFWSLAGLVLHPPMHTVARVQQLHTIEDGAS